MPRVIEWNPSIFLSIQGWYGWNLGKSSVEHRKSTIDFRWRATKSSSPRPLFWMDWVWVYVWGSPGFVVSEAIGWVLATSAPCRHIHNRELILNGHRYYIMRTKINVHLLLKKCLRLNMCRLQEICGLLIYERLPKICYQCGCIVHLQGAYTYLIPDDEDVDLWYGEWLTTTTKPSRLLWSSDNENLSLTRQIEIRSV